MLSALSNKVKMAAWAAKVESIIKQPPGSDDGLSADFIASQSRVSFSESSTWAILCEEVLDTQFSREYFDNARKELQRRGLADAEIKEMRRFVWLTAGWLNFEQGLWDWTSLDEQDIYRAIKQQHAEGYITAEERDRRLGYATRFQTNDHCSQ